MSVGSGAGGIGLHSAIRSWEAVHGVAGEGCGATLALPGAGSRRGVDVDIATGGAEHENIPALAEGREDGSMADDGRLPRLSVGRAGRHQDT